MEQPYQLLRIAILTRRTNSQLLEERGMDSHEEAGRRTKTASQSTKNTLRKDKRINMRISENGLVAASA
jgi:predicted DNA binding CopG/RHH family protein